MTTEEDSSDRAVLWRRHCEEPVRRAGGGGGPLGKVGHVGTGQEKTAIAKRVMADYPEFTVTVHFGFLLRAERGGQLIPFPVEARTEDELRDRIKRHIQMRELAAADREAAL